MRVTVQLGDEVSKVAEASVRRAVVATSAHDVNFSSYELTVERGDFTCIGEGDGHPNAPQLLALVHQVIDAPEFDTEGPFDLVPIACGGFAKILRV